MNLETDDSHILQVAEPALAYKLPDSQPTTPEQFLLDEASRDVRHEFVAGRVYALPAPSLRHQVIGRNIGGALDRRLRGGPCQVFTGGVIVHVEKDDETYMYYPDALVTCVPLDLARNVLTEPKVVFEVLSPSTERTDRREKSQIYHEIPALEEYILVAQHEPVVSVQRRAERWVWQVMKGIEAVVELQSLGVRIPLSRIYEGVPLELRLSA